MLGHSHALSGAAAWAATAALAPAVHVHPHAPAIGAGLFCTAGAALLPDLDHPQATTAYVFGPVSKALSLAVHRASGSHRHATHSLMFAAALPAASALAIGVGGRFVAWPLVFVLAAFGLRALKLIKPVLVILAALVFTIGAHFLLGADTGWIPWSVAVGILAHLAGDCLTKEGCPLLWPNRQHFMIPVIQRTGNRLETLFFAPVFGIGTIVILLLPHI